jgi:hypothetical protein
MSEKDVEVIVAKVDMMNEKIAICASEEELVKLQKERANYIINEFARIRTSKIV